MEEKLDDNKAFSEWELFNDWLSKNSIMVLNSDFGYTEFNIRDYTDLYYFALEFIEGDREYIVGERQIGASTLMSVYALYRANMYDEYTIISHINNNFIKQNKEIIDKIFQFNPILYTNIKVELDGEFLRINPKGMVVDNLYKDNFNFSNGEFKDSLKHIINEKTIIKNIISHDLYNFRRMMDIGDRPFESVYGKEYKERFTKF